MHEEHQVLFRRRNQFVIGLSLLRGRRVSHGPKPGRRHVTNTLYDAQKTLADLRLGIRNVSDLIGPGSVIPSDLKQTLEELSNAGRSLAELADFLKRNPNALLTGTKRPKEQP